MAKDPRPAAVEILKRIEKLKRLRTGGAIDVTVGSDSRDIVERCVEVISEASRHLPEAMKANHPEVHWRNVADIGNVLRHDYDGVIDSILIDVVLVQIDVLEAAVRDMMPNLAPE